MRQRFRIAVTVYMNRLNLSPVGPTECSAFFVCGYLKQGIFPSILCHAHQKTVQNPGLMTASGGQGSVL